METVTCYNHIVDSANDVYEKLGGGLSESIYQTALAVALRELGHVVEAELVVPIIYKNQYVGFVRPDLVINKEVVLELKSVSKIVETHIVQLRAYQRWLPRNGGNDMVPGAVINFGPTYVEVRPV